jgi:hypothetical protein
MRRIQVLVLCTGLTAVAQSAQDADKSIPLTVHVMDAVTGEPRHEVELFLQDVKLHDVAGPAKPDLLGNAEFRISPGSYVLRAQGAAFTVYHGQLPDGLVQTISIAPEDKAKSVTFPVASPGSLSGYVRDEWGDPIQNVQVHLIRAYWRDGALVFGLAMGAQTDHRGYYRIASIKPGAYVLCGLPSPNLRAPETGPVDFAQPGRQRYYQRACAPAEPVSSTPTPAAVLRISAGQHASVDLGLIASPTVMVKGRISGDFESVNLRLVSISLLPDVGLAQSSNVQNHQPEFTFSSVAPGRYRLEATGQRKLEKGGFETLLADMPVDVGGTDLEGLDVAPQPAAAIELRFHETEPGLAAAVTALGLLPAMHLGPLVFAQQGSDKVRRFQALREGAYWLYTRTTGEKKVCITGAQLGDRDVFRQPVILTAGMNAQLTLTLSSHCAIISGRAVWNGQPAPGARIVVLLRGTPENPGDSWSGFKDPEGGFELSDIAAGSYAIWAWQDDDSGLSVGPPDLASVARLATVVTVKEGDTAKSEIRILKLKEGSK